jgi:hypothetical protein
MWTLGERRRGRGAHRGRGAAVPCALRRPPPHPRPHAQPLTPCRARRAAEDGELHVTLTKLEAGDPWPAVLVGHEVDAVTQQKEQQRLMLERFQREVRPRPPGRGRRPAGQRAARSQARGAPGGRLARGRDRPRPRSQHPGFDFSQATFNGEAPNPRTFLGGMGGAGGS